MSGWGAIAQAGSDLMNVGHSAIQNRKARKHQEFMTKLVGRNAVQWRVQDMTKAGINPILAVRGGLAGATGAPSASMIGGAAKGGYAEAARASSLMKAQVELARNSARASQLDPMIRYAQLAEAEESALIAKANRKIRQGEVPRALAKEKILGDLYRTGIRHYDRLGGVEGMMQPTSAAQSAYDWLTMEHREGKTPLQRMRNLLNRKRTKK